MAKAYKAKRTIKMDDGQTVCFVKGRVYKRARPKIWMAPDPGINICLRDEQRENHYCNGEWLLNNFKEV